MVLLEYQNILLLWESLPHHTETILWKLQRRLPPSLRLGVIHVVCRCALQHFPTSAMGVIGAARPQAPFTGDRWHKSRAVSGDAASQPTSSLLSLFYHFFLPPLLSKQGRNCAAALTKRLDDNVYEITDVARRSIKNAGKKWTHTDSFAWSTECKWRCGRMFMKHGARPSEAVAMLIRPTANVDEDEGGDGVQTSRVQEQAVF